MRTRFTLALLLISTLSFAQNTLKSNFERHITTLASEEFEGRGPKTKGDTLSVNYIINELKQINSVELMGDNGLQVVTDSARKWSLVNPKKKLKKGEKPEYKIEKYLLETFNVVARIKAPVENNPNGESIIIGAHYDHMGMVTKKDGSVVMYPGADDNASGTAFVIEYARELAKTQKDLKRDVIFVLFGAEEKGLVGSRFYAAHPLYPLDKAVAMYNFDMTGHMVKKGITIRGLASAVEAPHVFATLPNKDGLDLIWEFRAKGPTDYASFYSKGVPAFSFCTRLHKDYHTERDTIELINYEGMVMLFDYVKNVINRTAFENFYFTYVKS